MLVRCTRCGKHRYLRSDQTKCGCQPFEVEHEGDTQTIHAVDEEEAAEIWAVAYNEESADYSMMSGDPSETIKIGGKPYRVTAEACIQYTVDEL